MATDGLVQVPADSTGKKIDTTELTVGTNTVERQRVQIAGAAATDLAPVDSVKGLKVDLTSTGANATALKVDGSAATQPVSAASLPLPTGASTAAKQPALGTAGAASADVITIQGVASMTAVKVDGSATTQPVSGTVTANMGTVTADPFGANADAASATGSISAKLRFIAGTGIPITGTVTVASHAVTNAGTFAVQATLAAGAASIAKAEDVASADADVGVPAMAVRKASPANTSGTDGDYEMLQISAGRLWVSAVIDTALPAGTNAIGKLSANAGVIIGDVNVVSEIPGTGATALGKAEDAAASSGDTGVAVLAVRRDVAASGVSTDGDYANLSVDSNGALRVTGGGGGTQYNVDDVASVTATGTFALVVRKDSAASLAGTDGDVTALQVDANGSLRVTGGGGGTEYTEDAAAAANPVGQMLITRRKDTLSAAEVSTDGDNIAVNATAKGEIYVKHADAIPVTDNAGSLTVDNGGTFATQESQLAADDSAFTIGTTKVFSSGYMADETSTDSVDEGDVGIARMTLDRKVITTTYAHGAGGASVASGSIAATKTDIGTANTPGTVLGWYFYNANASVAYVQFFNAQASAVTLGTTVPVYSLGIPAGSAANVPANMPGIAHSTAISIAITTTRAGSTGVGTTVDYNIFYKQ